MNPIKIAIADDHRLIAEGIANMLRYNTEIEVVAFYPNGEAVLEGITRIAPDILLLDIQMPELQGDEIAKILKKNNPELKIIVLTSFDNIFYIKNMLQYNIEGYLLKDIEKPELVEAITLVYQGATYLDKRVEKILREDEKVIARQKTMGSVLTNRETEILQLIVQGHTSAEIAEKLFISKRTAEHHRAAIFNKLDVKQVSTLIQKATQLNLIPPKKM